MSWHLSAPLRVRSSGSLWRIGGTLRCRPWLPAGVGHCRFKLQPWEVLWASRRKRYHHRKQEVQVPQGPPPAIIPPKGGDCLAIMWVLQFAKYLNLRCGGNHQKSIINCWVFAHVQNSDHIWNAEKRILFLKNWRGFNESFALQIHVCNFSLLSDFDRLLTQR